MKTETITAPLAKYPPEMRYASLHRTIENGMASDRTWLELVQVGLELNRRDEARRAFDQLTDPHLQRRAYNLLLAAGELVDVPKTAAAAKLNAPTGARGLVEWVTDAFRFLFQDHMPLAVVVATVTFPLVVGLGGFMTAGVHNSFILPLIALIPALSVVGLIGALGRRILIEASQGLDDAPEIPAVAMLIRESGRFLLDSSALAAIFLGPAMLLTQISEVGSSAVAAAFAVGGALLPMALAMRQTRDDWTCLSPMELSHNIRRAGPRYFVAVGVSFVLMTPAAISIWLTAGSALYLVISVVGPLVVVPIFVMARLFGQTISDLERERADQERQVHAAQRVVTPSGPVVAPSVNPVRHTPLRAANHAVAQPQHEASTVPSAKLTDRTRVNDASQETAAASSQKSGRSKTERKETIQMSEKKQQVLGGSVGLRSARGMQPSSAQRSSAPPEPHPIRSTNREEPASDPAAETPTQSQSPAPTPGRAPAPSVERRNASASAATPRLRPRDDDDREANAPAPERYRAKVASIVGDHMPDLTKMPGVSVVKGSARVTAGAASNPRTKNQ